MTGEDSMMLPPEHDLVDRAPVWDAMQMLWMDTNPHLELPGVARACAGSKYSTRALAAIYWNEVRPAVGFNLLIPVTPQWTGFELEWLKRRVLRKSRYGSDLPRRWLHPYAARWWRRLEAEIVRLRAQSDLS